MPVAVYCRVSSEEQAERGTIEIQKNSQLNMWIYIS